MTKKLITDIRPQPVKERSALGIVELILEEGQSVKAVGVVYGLEHKISGPGFQATLFMDQYNQRIKILEYSATDYEAMILKARWLAEANGFDKTICMAGASDWTEFLKHGWVLEAVIKYYRKGEDAFVVSKFRSQDRLHSKSLMEEILQIEEIMSKPPQRSTLSVIPNAEIRLARAEDIPQLIALYQSIFETYPSPLVHVSYLETIFQKQSLFAVCVQNGKILAAASAELSPSDLSAELTDCATLPEARGKGLISAVLSFLENHLKQKSYICAYTMARARSFGMNQVFYHLGYSFCGRLINNCDIFGGYEDMNIWARKLIS